MHNVALTIGAAAVGTAGAIAQQASEFAGGLTAPAEQIWGLGLGPFLTLICIALCVVVVYLWRTYRTDTSSLVDKLVVLETKSQAIAIDHIEAQTKGMAAIDSLTVEVKRLADKG
jgi:hypothetical protein